MNTFTTNVFKEATPQTRWTKGAILHHMSAALGFGGGGHVNNTSTLAVAINTACECFFSAWDYTPVSICSTQNATLPENAFVQTQPVADFLPMRRKAGFFSLPPLLPSSLLSSHPQSGSCGEAIIAANYLQIGPI